MMLNENVAALLNNQINKEFFSAYLYLDMANYYYSKSLNGFGNWFKVQAQEERDHANLFIAYLLNNGCNISLGAIDAPAKAYADFKTPLTESLAHEQYVTSLIHTIYAESVKLHDFRTTQFLDWFVKEQGEEEKNIDELIKRYELFGSDTKGLYMLDSELAARVYAPPSLVI
jgi:ferritin